MDLLMTTNDVYLIIDAGGTYLKSALLRKDGEICVSSSFSVPSCSSGTLEEVKHSFKQIFDYAGIWSRRYGLRIGGVGISIPGPFDYRSGISLMKHKYQCLYGLSVKELFRESGCIGADIPVWFMHDVNAVLAGEMWKGNAWQYRNMAIVTLGTGLGFACSLSGVIQSTELGSPLRSIFRMPYQNGILEDYVSQRGFIRLYKEQVECTDESLTVRDIAQMAAEGNKAALATFQEVAQILSESLAGILIEQRIECLLFGGQISRSFSFMENTFRQMLGKVTSLRQISPVTSIDNAAFWGTLTLMV